MAAPQIILELIERFERNSEAYKSVAYNETQARHEFIDPFFEALGWDVNNTTGHAEAYKDVIHEDTVKVSGVTKAPDYSFRIGGQRKFFVEAKKPSINIKNEPAAAFQVRRCIRIYLWLNICLFERGRLKKMKLHSLKKTLDISSYTINIHAVHPPSLCFFGSMLNLGGFFLFKEV